MMPILLDPAARRRWSDYLADLDRRLAHVGADAPVLRDALIQHVADSMAAAPAFMTERDQLEAALARLGRPGDVLPDRTGDGRAASAPVIARALLAGLPGAVRGLGLGVVSLLALVSVAMAVLKPVFWTHVGLFRSPDGVVGVGILAHTAGARDVLGWWSIPVSVALSILLVLVLRAGARAGRDRPTVC